MSNYRQTSVNITPATDAQVAALSAKGFGTFTDIVRIAIDRMAKEEGYQTMTAKTIKLNDLIAIDAAPNTHGCRDYAILRYRGDGEAIVIEAQSCTSCWQVGHDRDHVFATIGEVRKIDIGAIEPAGNNWSRDVSWQLN